MFMQGGSCIKKDMLLLDTCSSISTVFNKELIRNCSVLDVRDHVQLLANGNGNMIYKHEGDLNLLPLKVYYNEESMANVLAMKDIVSIPGVKITMDTSKGREIKVCRSGSDDLVFKECDEGLQFGFRTG